jgi:hypothetical protein
MYCPVVTLSIRASPRFNETVVKRKIMPYAISPARSSAKKYDYMIKESQKLY